MWLAESLGAEIARIERPVPVGSIDASLYARRHRAAAGVARLGERDPVRGRRLDRGAGRRRALHRAHRPGRSRCDHRLRSASRRTAPPCLSTAVIAAADPARLRRADLPTSNGGLVRHRRGRGHIVKHFRSIAETGADATAPAARSLRPHGRGQPATQPEGPALRGKTVCNVFFEDSTRTRLSFETGCQATIGRHHEDFAVSSSSVNEGEASATSSRRSPPWASMPSSSGTVERGAVAGQPVDAGERDQRRRRLARTPDASRRSTATRSAPPSTAPVASTGSGSRSWATSSTAGSRAATSRPSRCSEPTSPSSPRGRCCRRSSTCRRPPISTLIDGLDVIYLLRCNVTDDRSARAEPARVQDGGSASPERARGCPSTR